MKKLPESFKGTSGAGVWKILLKKKPEDNLENITFDPPVLSGLVFYQTYMENNKRRLRCHGGLNYETPFDKLQKVTELLS